MKIGIFTDLHLGVQKDSQIRLDETIKCIDWIIDQFKKNQIDWIIFDGDFFDSRFSINVQTLNYAIQIISKLNENFQKIFFIIGNHDTYYKNTNDVNSINFFTKLSSNEKIVIVDEEPLFLSIQDKEIGLFPWGFDINTFLEENKDYTPVDYGFGHFEVNGVEQAGSISSGCKYHYNDLFKLADKIYSGHYHNYTSYKKDKIIMLGSPLQLNWGEWNRPKYIYILDVINDELIKFENQVNIKFDKVYYSLFEKNKYTGKQLKKIVENNFIKFIIDKAYQFENIMKYTEVIKKLNPSSLQIQYLISLTSDLLSESTEQIIKAASKDNKDYLYEYVDKIYNQIKEKDSSIDLEILHQYIDNYYKKSISNDIQN